jgi:hypothetical protein
MMQRLLQAVEGCGTLKLTLFSIDCARVPKRKITNAKNSRPAFEGYNKKEMPIPTCFDDYNHHMGGVDIADQLRCYYDIQLICWRTWWPLFFYAMDTMITNSYIIYCDIPGVPKITHKAFRLSCAWGLILAADTPKAASNSSSNSSKASRGKYIKKDTVLPSDRRCECGHMSVYGQKRVVCWLCRWKHREQGASDNLPKTKWSCRQCALPLCMNRERNCFSELHYL